MQNKQDIVIIDETEPCPYLPDQTARMPLRMPLRPLDRRHLDEMLASGHRRTGEFVYQTQCPQCMACQPIRIDCNEFHFGRSWRRIINRGDRLYHQRIGPLHCSPDRVDLFNKHRRLRGLARWDADIDAEEYRWGFIKSCFESFEIAYFDAQHELVCLAVCDQGQESLSAVYTFYDPDRRAQSLGTYSILKQIQFCKDYGCRYLYLGFYVENSAHMKYKDRFRPQQRLIDGVWRTFD